MLRSRLVGIMIVAIFYVLLGLLWIAVGINEMRLNMNISSGLSVLVIGVICVFSAIGAMRLKLWGRQGLIGASVATIIMLLIEPMRTRLISPETPEAEFIKKLSGAFIIISIFSFLYLLLPRTKQLFL